MRSELIDRLIGGEELRPCEIRFLTYTSSTLNKFLDRHLYQKSVDMLDPDMIEEVPSSR
jgi:hypothetical protein